MQHNIKSLLILLISLSMYMSNLIAQDFKLKAFDYSSDEGSQEMSSGINVSPSSLNFGSIRSGTISNPQAYTISWNNLSDNIVVSSNSPNFKVSLFRDSGYTSSLVLPALTLGEENSEAAPRSPVSFRFLDEPAADKQGLPDDLGFFEQREKIIRYRPVEVNTVHYDQFAKNDQIFLPLFDDFDYTAKVRWVDENINGTFTVIADVEEAKGYVVITTTNNRTLANIYLPESNKFFTVTNNAFTGSHYLLEMDATDRDILLGSEPLIPPVSEDEIDERRRMMEALEGEGAMGPNDPAVIDVMIVYTPAAQNWANISGGGIQNVIAQAMANAQLTLDNSMVGITMNLVKSSLVNYEESGSSGVDLRRLTASSSFNPFGDYHGSYYIPGYMNEVHSWRDQSGADLVALFSFVEDTGGLAWVLSNANGRPNYGFSITRVQQAATSYTHIHEMGHNMGCGHHKLQNYQAGPGLFSYSAGWRWRGSNGNYYCSVMTYESGSYFSDGITHQRIPVFSNPNVLYHNASSGHPVDGDNARTIRETKHAIASYRQSSVIVGANIWVRFEPNASGSFSGTITNSTAGYPSRQVSVNGHAHTDDLPTTLYENWQDYSNFTTSISPWSSYLINNDYTFHAADFDFPGEGSRFAFMAFNPSQTTPPINNVFAPVDGERMLAAVQSRTPNDNKWLISPPLRGTSNSILSFYARSITAQYGHERIRILVSTTGTRPEDFVMVSDGNYVEVPTSWTKFSYNLAPYVNGKNYYFAIQYVSYDAFILFLDALEVTDKAGLTHHINLKSQPSWGGLVTGDGFYQDNATVTIEAIPNVGWRFIDWIDGGFVASYNTTYSFAAKENKTLTARFSIQKHNLSLSVNPPESGAVTGEGQFNHGTSVTATAIPSSGWDFKNWTDEDIIVSEDVNYIFNLTSSRNLVANFEQASINITTLANPLAGGAALGEGRYQKGDSVAVVAMPNDGWQFLNWTEGQNIVSSENGYTFIATTHRELTANFEPKKYSVSLSANPLEGGLVSGANEYAYGTEVVISATANDNWRFLNWKENNSIVSEEANHSFLIYENKSFVANFEAHKHEIKAFALPAQAGNILGSGEYSHGSEVTLTAVANPGYMFEAWYEDGDIVSTNSTFSFAANASRNFVGNFVSRKIDIALSSKPNNGGQLSGGGKFDLGESITIVATPNTEYEFVHWECDGVIVSDSASYTFVVEDDQAFMAYFSLKQYQVSLNAEPANGGSVYGSGVFDHGSNVTIHATPNSSWHFKHWLENDNIISTESSYSFDITENRIFTASFNPASYTISVSANPPDGGTFIGAGTYAQNVEAKVVANANHNYFFVNWTEGGIIYHTSNEYSFVVNSNRNLVANFQTTTSNVSVQQNEPGILLYPNPADKEITIDLTKPEKINLVRVTDMMGQEVLLVRGSEKQYKLDVSHLNPGIYIIGLVGSSHMYNATIHIIR